MVLTEHHCVANADCLAEVELFFRQHEFDGACLKIDWVCLNEIARLKWSQRNQERLSFFTAPDHWNKFLFAGFAIQRDKLLSAGGLEYQYGLFLEVAVGAKLHAQGYRLGHAERAVIRHLDDNSFGKVLDFIRNFTEGEILFLANNDSEYCERYFGFVEEWGQRFSGGPERARSVLRLLCRALWCELLSRSPDRRAKPIARELCANSRAPSCRAAFASSEPIWVSSPLGPASPSGGSTSRDAFARSRTRATEWFTTYVRKASSGGMLPTGTLRRSPSSN